MVISMRRAKTDGDGDDQQGVSSSSELTVDQGHTWLRRSVPERRESWEGQL